MITMPKEMKAKWVEALRSGEYKQCQWMLSDGTGYCCLGVLQMVVDGRVEVDPRYSVGVPSYDWCEMNGIELTTTKNFAGPWEPAKGHGSLTQINDAGKSFEHIADIIQTHVVGV